MTSSANTTRALAAAALAGCAGGPAPSWTACGDVDLPNLSSDFVFAQRPLAMPSWCTPWAGVVPVFVNGVVQAWRLDGAPLPLPPARTFQASGRPAAHYSYLEIDTRRLADGAHRLEIDAALAWRPEPLAFRAMVAVANANLPTPRFAGGLVEVTAAAGLPPGAGTADARASRYVARPTGAVAGDLDGDGDADVLAWTPAGAQAYCQGPGFVFAACGALLPGRFVGGGFGDLDGDGAPDAVLVGDGITILRNVGGTLTDVTAGAFADAQRRGRAYDGVTFADLDADGLLDVAVAEMDCGGGTNVVLRNEGGTFQFADVAPALGVDTPGAATFALAVDAPAPGADDGALHVWTMAESCTAVPTQHFVFDPGDDLPRPRGRPTPVQSAPMGSGWLDADGDGALHLLASDYQGEFVWRTPRSTADPPGGAAELRPFHNGVGNDPDLLGKPAERWAQVVLDADMDGRADVFIAGERELRGPTQVDLDGLFWAGPGGLRDVAALAGLGGHQPCRAAHGADLDGDGDTDLLVGCADRLRLLRNDLARSDLARTVVLHGTVSNADGVHAVLVGPDGERRLSRGGGQPYAGGVVRESIRCPPDRRFTVLWPSGIRQDVPCGAVPWVHVREPAAVTLSTRRVAAGGGQTVTVDVDPRALGTPGAAVVVEPSAGAWLSPMALGADGRWRAQLRLPSERSTVAFTVTVGTVRLRVRPRVFVR